MQETETPGRHLLCAVLAFCAALALYAPAVSDKLIWDDVGLIGGNAFATNCANLPAALNPANLVKVLPVPMAARPLVNVSLIADACTGAGPAGMKLTNVLLHAFNAAALFFLLLTLSGSEAGALFGALLFAVHPVAAETVHIITFRSHLLGLLFFNFGLAFAVFYGRKPAASTAASAALCYFLALLSIETPIVLPLAVMLAVYFDSGREGLKRTVPLLAALAAIALFYLWFRLPRSGYAIAGITAPGIAGPSLLYPSGLLPGTGHKADPGTMLLPWRAIYASPAANLFTMSRITLEYFGTLLAALGLNNDYSPAVISSFRQGLAPLAAALSLLAAGVVLFLRRNLAGLGILLAFATLLPVLNIAPIYNIQAGRYLYLPLAGFALAAASVFGAALERKGWKNAALAGAALWICGLAAVSVRRNPEFRNNLSFFTASVKRNPRVPRAQVNLSRALLVSRDCTGAIEHARTASELDRGNPLLRVRVASTQAFCGRRADARKEAEETLKMFPGNASAIEMVNTLGKNKPLPIP